MRDSPPHRLISKNEMKEELVKSLLGKKVVAIVRGFAPETCLRLAEAYRLVEACKGHSC